MRLPHPLTLFAWNAHQAAVWLRYARRHHEDTTPEAVAAFARRYSEKHRHERATIARAA